MRGALRRVGRRLRAGRGRAVRGICVGWGGACVLGGAGPFHLPHPRLELAMRAHLPGCPRCLGSRATTPGPRRPWRVLTTGARN